MLELYKYFIIITIEPVHNVHLGDKREWPLTVKRWTLKRVWNKYVWTVCRKKMVVVERFAVSGGSTILLLFVWAFSCGWAKTICIRYVWRRNGEKVMFSKISGYARMRPETIIPIVFATYFFVRLPIVQFSAAASVKQSSKIFQI